MWYNYWKWAIWWINEWKSFRSIYLDFLKAPIIPEGQENYTIKVDLISELKTIETHERSFYDFYADIQNALYKARDGHLSVTVSETPNGFPLDTFRFCLPFYYTMKEVLDDNNKVIDAYLTIESKFGMFCSCTQEIMMKTLNLRGKKIISINGKNPYEYFEEMNEKGYITHSTQAKFIEMLSSIDALRAEDYPLKKEDLKVSIKFEGEEEEFAVEYNFEETPFLVRNLKSIT